MADKGRPTEYKEEYIQKADEYLKANKDEYEEFHKTRGEKSDGYERLVRVKLPTIEGFALMLGHNKHALYDWEKKYPKFSHALDKIREEQRKRLINGGLSGDYNSTIAKLILSSNHGYKEKTEQDITSKGDKVVGFNFISNGSNDKTDNQAGASMEDTTGQDN
jgi:hypothetical protein